jgi:3-phosphoshikimate 1-carboxyvinyltransferase
VTERVIRVPGDKSITHRALMLGALAAGTNRVANALHGADPRATAAALRSLGCAIPALSPAGEPLVFDGIGAGGLRLPAGPIDCANSGTTARLLLGLLAGVPVRATLTGDASLRRRPMRRVTAPLTEMGARFEELGEADRLPIAIDGGALRPLEHESAHASAQVKSALLLAGVTGGVRVAVREPLLSRDHTERMLAAMGARLRTERFADGRALVVLEEATSLAPLDLTVPGDFSSAAFFLALGLLGDTAVRVTAVGVNPTRAGLLPVLRRMGAHIALENARIEGGEEVADIVAHPSDLEATSVTPSEIPALIDEVPVLAILAARARGETRITGAAELRVKESDRLAVLAGNLRAVGAVAEELSDGLVIAGSASPLAGRVRTHDDHRIAMAFGILGAAPRADLEIDEPDVVAVSFPGFWELLRGSVKA